MCLEMRVPWAATAVKELLQKAQRAPRRPNHAGQETVSARITESSQRGKCTTPEELNWASFPRDRTRAQRAGWTDPEDPGHERLQGPRSEALLWAPYAVSS